MDDASIERGYVEPAVRAEFPELALVHTTVAATPRRSPRDVREALRLASDRFSGPRAIVMRQQPIPWAYRVFFRHIGIDPDERRTPIEQIAVDRLRAGGFRSSNTVDDAILLATLETAVPVVAFDGDRVAGQVGIRVARAGEALGGDGLPLSEGQLVIADDFAPIGVLFGERSPAHAPGPGTRSVLLAAVQVKGVPDVSVEEALWMAGDALSRPEPGSSA